MILLDSSIIRAIGFPHDAALTMVRILAERTGHTVALPETVSHEYLSDRRSDLDKKRKAAQAAVADLLGAAPDWPGRDGWTGLAYPDVDTVIKGLEEQLRTVFHVVPLTEAAAKGGLQREAYRQAPASTGEKAGGARDASIWLTTLEQCRAASPAKIYLVAADGDFGSGRLRPELIGEAPANLVYCHGIDKVLAELADSVDVAAGEPQAVLQTENVKQAVQQALTGPEVMYEITKVPAITGVAVQSIGQTSIALERVPDPSKMHAYKAGNDLFVAAELEWRAERQYVDATSGTADRPVFNISFKVKTTVIIVLTDTGAIRALNVAHRGPISDVEWALAATRFSAFTGLASA